MERLHEHLAPKAAAVVRDPGRRGPGPFIAWAIRVQCPNGRKAQAEPYNLSWLTIQRDADASAI